MWSKKELEVSDVVLLMDRFGYVKTVDTSTYDRNKDTADAENKLILKVKNIDKLCIFTNNGNMHLVKVLDLPYGKFRDKGTPIDNVSNYDSSKEDIVFIAPLMDVEKHKLIFGTKSAMIKLVDGAEFVVTRKTSQAQSSWMMMSCCLLTCFQRMLQWECVQRRRCSFESTVALFLKRKRQQ